MPPAAILARFACAALLGCIAAAVAAPPAAAAPGHWQRPVAGPVTRAFDYGGDPFAAGRDRGADSAAGRHAGGDFAGRSRGGGGFAAGLHRGADFAARPGAPVRSACAGRVIFAGVAGANGPTVSVRCGAWRVAYLPLRTLAVHRGARVARGESLGTAAGTGRHAGLHVGIRREGSRWGYVDPLPFFGPAGQSPLAPPRRVTRPPRTALPAAPQPEAHPTVAERRVGAPVRRPLGAPRTRPLGAPATRPLEAPRTPPLGTPRTPPLAAPTTPPLAPWPAWAGLTLVLAGALGARLGRRRRGRRPHSGAVAAGVVQSDAG